MTLRAVAFGTVISFGIFLRQFWRGVSQSEYLETLDDTAFGAAANSSCGYAG